MSVKFEDYHIDVESKINDKTIGWLYEAVQALVGQTQQNSIRRTGRTRGSWETMVDEADGKGYVGSNYMNAVWEEFGTGIYALNGDGRRTPWFYVDEEGKGHFTHGKKPRRMLYHAGRTLEKPLVNRLKEILNEI